MRTSTPTNFHRAPVGADYISARGSRNSEGASPGAYTMRPYTHAGGSSPSQFSNFSPCLGGRDFVKNFSTGTVHCGIFPVKSPRRFVGNFPLWKARNLSTRGCGGAALAIPGFAPLFHIKSYYYCCCYIYPLFLLERKTANAPIFPGAVENPAAQRRLIYEIFLR